MCARSWDASQTHARGVGVAGGLLRSVPAEGGCPCAGQSTAPLAEDGARFLRSRGGEQRLDDREDLVVGGTSRERDREEVKVEVKGAALVGARRIPTSEIARESGLVPGVCKVAPGEQSPCKHVPQGDE